MNRDDSLQAVRRRVEELARAKPSDLGTAEAEVLASLADGARTFDGLDDAMLDQCLRRFGRDAVIDALIDGDRKPSAPAIDAVVPRPAPDVGSAQPERPRAVGWPTFAWVAAAASVVLAAALFWLLPRPVPSTSAGVSTPGTGAPAPIERPAPQAPSVPPTAPQSPTPAPRFASEWPSVAPFNPRGNAWRAGQARLPRTLPSFDDASRTLGVGGSSSYQRWRLNTVIVRSNNGWGSGALISADGWLLSNYHVVAEAAQQAALTGALAVLDVIAGEEVNGRIKPRPAVKATLFRVDPVLDLALLKLQTRIAGAGFFPLASSVRDGADCFVIGSQHNGPAWSIRSGNVLHEFDYPEDLSQTAAGVTSQAVTLDRNRLTVTVSDTAVSPGDSGGPLINEAGELIGLTFATSANQSGGAVGWHIGLDHVRSFVASLPAQPEGVPFDPWTAGAPRASTLRPEIIDGDVDGHPETLLYYYAEAQRSEAPEALGSTMFVDLAERSTARTTRGRALDDLVPFGLWGMETRGKFRFDVFLTVRADGKAIVGYADTAGVVSEIRVGAMSDMKSAVVWNRHQSGVWTATVPKTPLPLIDSSRITAADDARMQRIAQRMLTGPSSLPTGPRVTPRPPDRRGPNRMGEQS